MSCPPFSLGINKLRKKMESYPLMEDHLYTCATNLIVIDLGLPAPGLGKMNELSTITSLKGGFHFVSCAFTFQVLILQV